MIRSAAKAILSSVPKGDSGDRIFSFCMFLRAHGRVPRRDSGLFNDYLYFLKTSKELYNPERQYTSDKSLVKNYVQSILGTGFTPETIGLYSSVKDIPFTSIQVPCVLKPCHASGCIVFVSDSRKLRAADLNELERTLLISPYETAREKNYRYLSRQIICEKMLPAGREIKDYKIFCFQGRPRLVQVDSSRHDDHRRNIYDVSWKRLDISYNFPQGQWEEAPLCLDAMLDAAQRLSATFTSARIDFYVLGDSFYIGEITHCPESAHGRFDSLESERLFSNIYFNLS